MTCSCCHLFSPGMLPVRPSCSSQRGIQRIHYQARSHYITEWVGKSICGMAAGMVYWLWETTVLQGGWPLFYIGWGWCWWNILILRTWWPSECSFWHYWHSFLRLPGNAFGIEKPPQNFDRVQGWIFLSLFIWSTHLGGGCLFVFIIYHKRGESSRVKSFVG